MQVPSSSHRRAVGANMTPMIDVVFLLIIFFLVSSHLARQETRLPLDLPIAESFAPLNPERAPLTISVDSAGDIRVAGKVVGLPRLKSILREHRGERGRDASVRIRSDEKIQYRFVQPVLREAALTGVTDASIAVRER